MPIISAPQEYNEDNLYVDLRPVFGPALYLKCEAFNFAGSVKLKAAREMITSAERRGLLTPGATLVESSSGNLGVALSMIAADRGYGFVCVTDARCNEATRRMMEAFGARVHVVTEPAAEGGFLGARIACVRTLCARNGFVWLNQYGNRDNWMAHYLTTAPAIARQFPDVDVLFVGAGTTGTLMGCARYFRTARRAPRIVAVDVEGSVTFGRAPARRLIPGLGTSVRPGILNESFVDEVVHVTEPDAVRRCRELARRGFLFGGSTGTVIAGALAWLDVNAGSSPATAVAIAPDFGERYLATVYDDAWVRESYWPEYEPAYEDGRLSELNAAH
ncbi:2,3-diaminopropionate biosynthesis protein SbnA [Amycolatopsis sp. NBC_01488]|uniref:2,3-diaminopropionate biosynthesis protein SbnA n=1 Tax=Amycolatopsis sp. NBC_01488 TaxID=2903563 RepID=UPI002E2DA45D|nr:2,3-diaminopropionate biosynthesis protein SbnA [Amycolatopsis sp. NBC_01488]